MTTVALAPRYRADPHDVSIALAYAQALRGSGQRTQAVSVLETFQRACLTLGIETAPDVDELASMGAAATRPEDLR